MEVAAAIGGEGALVVVARQTNKLGPVAGRKECNSVYQRK